MNLKKVKCKCGFEDEYEYCEFGLSYYQAIGECPHCEELLDSKEIFEIKIKK